MWLGAWEERTGAKQDEGMEGSTEGLAAAL